MYFSNNIVRIGYSRLHGMLYCDRSNLLLAGNIIDYDIPGSGFAAVNLSGGRLEAVNNYITAVDTCLQLQNLGAPSSIYNSTFWTTDSTFAIFAAGSQPITMIADAVYGSLHSDYLSPYPRVIWSISYCAFSRSSDTSRASYSSCNDCYLNFVSPGLELNTNGFVTPPNSVCIAAGPPEAVYNNRGTTNRNDIGYTGGPFFNPANYTNDAPMIYWLKGSPVFFSKGQSNTLNISAAAVAGD